MANAIKTQFGSEVSFKPSGGTVVFTPTSLANGQGRISSQHDFGTAPRATTFTWKAVTALGTAGSAGLVIEVYIAQSDGVDQDGAIGTSDATFTTGTLRYNLTRLGTIINDDASAGFFIASGVVNIYQRYVNVAWWNASGQALSSTAGDHTFKLVPLYPEVQ